MAIDWNQVTIAVNLGQDAEQRQLPSGKGVVNFSGAATRRYTQNGEKQEKTDWFKFVLFGDHWDNLLPYLKKGTPVLVDGRLSSRSYEDKNGVKREVVEIVGNRVQLTGGNRDNNGSRSSNTQRVEEPEPELDEIPF